METMGLETGFCHCGCGKKTKICSRNYIKEGYIKGDYKRFLPGHWIKSKIGSDSIRWSGGKHINNGYVMIFNPEHPRAKKTSYIAEHVLIVEAIIKKFLSEDIVVHHINNIRSDNRPENLVVCQDENYHRLLHQRTRAFRACGHANWRKCRLCKQYDDIDNLACIMKKNNFYHRTCINDYNRRHKETIEGEIR